MQEKIYEQLSAAPNLTIVHPTHSIKKFYPCDGGLSLLTKSLSDKTKPLASRATLHARTGTLSGLLHSQLNPLAPNLNSNHLRRLMAMKLTDARKIRRQAIDVTDADDVLLHSRRTLQLHHCNKKQNEFHIYESQ
jgi:hypothetical protein